MYLVKILNTVAVFQALDLSRYWSLFGVHSLYRTGDSSCNVIDHCRRNPAHQAKLLAHPWRDFTDLLIGASLSEPHTSVTSLRACVCMLVCLLAWTDHIPEILNIRFHLHVHNSNSKRSVESSSSSCSSTPMGLPSVSTTMELLSVKERLRLEREGKAATRFVDLKMIS